MPLYHMDVYRLEDSSEDLGFDEYFEGNGVTVVEWAHLIEEQLPTDTIKYLYLPSRGRHPKFVFKPYGKRYVDLCKGIIFMNILALDTSNYSLRDCTDQ